MSLRVCNLFGSCLLFLEGLYIDLLMLHLPRILVVPMRGLGVVVDADNFLGVGCVILLTIGPVLEAVVLIDWQRLPRLLVRLLLFRSGLSRFLRRLRESTGCICDVTFSLFSLFHAFDVLLSFGGWLGWRLSVLLGVEVDARDDLVVGRENLGPVGPVGEAVGPQDVFGGFLFDFLVDDLLLLGILHDLLGCSDLLAVCFVLIHGRSLICTSLHWCCWSFGSLGSSMMLLVVLVVPLGFRVMLWLGHFGDGLIDLLLSVHGLAHRLIRTNFSKVPWLDLGLVILAAVVLRMVLTLGLRVVVDFGNLIITFSIEPCSILFMNQTIKLISLRKLLLSHSFSLLSGLSGLLVSLEFFTIFICLGNFSLLLLRFSLVLGVGVTAESFGRRLSLAVAVDAVHRLQGVREHSAAVRVSIQSVWHQGLLVSLQLGQGLLRLCFFLLIELF